MSKRSKMLGTLPVKVLVSIVLTMALTCIYGQVEVRTAEDLVNIREDLGGDYIQVADIDIREHRNWQPIGSQEAPFTGTYNGNGHIISNLSINEVREVAGLFGMIAEEARISSLGLEDVNINIPEANIVGGLVGMMMDNSAIDRCYSDGLVRGHEFTGGLVGYIRAREQPGPRITNSYATGRVNPTSHGAGLLGGNDGGIITNCYAGAHVEGPPNRLGGLIGIGAQGGEVNSSHWDVQVSGQEESQGGTGSTTEEMLDRQVYQNWDFEDIWSIGFEGEGTYPYLQWQREPGDHNYPPEPLLPGPRNLEAIAGNREVNLSWDAPNEGDVANYRLYRNNAVLTNLAANIRQYRDDDVTPFAQYSYHVTAIWEDETESASSNVAHAIPHGFTGGDGTEENPYHIENAAQLAFLRTLVGAANANLHFVQTAHIELEGNWTPIGTDAQQFRGTFDGDGFEISGLTTARAFRMGLFGYTSTGAELKNIHIRGMNLLASHESGGLVANAANTTISNCSVTGRMDHSTNFYFGGLVGLTSGNTSVHKCWTDVEMLGTGRIYIGGLIGQHGGTGAVSESFSLGSLTTTNNNADLMMGGLIGRLTNGEVVNCYSMATVICPQNNNQIGGLIGNNVNRAVSNSFSVGQVVSAGNFIGGLIGISNGQVTNSYWSTEMSGQAQSAGGTPLSIADMIDRISYVGWDFGGDDEPGVWRIDENSFPYLSWEGDEAGEHSFPPVFLPPSNLNADVADDRESLTISWTEPSLAAPEGYNIYRDGDRINQTLVDDVEFRDNNIQLWSVYIYTVTAVYSADEELIESPPSGTLRVIVHEYEDGEGTAENPFLVGDEAQLNGIRMFLEGHYRLVDDIDLSRQAWVPIGTNTNAFSGSFDGDEYEIQEMHFENNSAYQGLFGYTDGAALRNITLVDVDIQGGNYVGALIGRADNTPISNCSVSGTVRGAGNVGGMLGRFTGLAEDSHSTATVIGTGDRVGGFIGDSWGNVNRCFATGNVTGVNRVGGFSGNDYNGTHNQVFATGRVEGNNQVGGLFGFIQTATYNDCYATGDVAGNDMVGGYVGRSEIAGTTNRAYSIGRVTAQGEAGGLIGSEHPERAGQVNSSYWNTRTSGQQESRGGEGRDERGMAYPYEADTYVGWSFDNVWQADELGDRNGGYPFFPWQPIFTSPNPAAARNPNPADRAVNVPIDIEEIAWSYIVSESFTNPVGFRVYMNMTGNFGADDDYVWIDYTEDQENYFTAEILPEEIAYHSTYFWKVVPTTIDPEGDGRSGDSSPDRRKRQSGNERMFNATTRGDAQNVPIWRFTTQVNPNPVAATNPQPEDEAVDIPVDLANIGWTYTVDQSHANPIGFRVYMNTTGEFGEDDDFAWVNFQQNQANYTTSDILPEELEYDESYYWKVVPTTDMPGRNREYHSPERRRRVRSIERGVTRVVRGDAENVPVWSFTTEGTNPNPLPAVNPDPEHLATGISLGIENVSWDYITSEIYADPVGFRVYLNTTGAFGSNAPFVWVDYEENQVRYSSTEIIPEYIDENTTYYWRVVPTTIHPDERQTQNAGSAHRQNHNSLLRGDAENCPIWRFTTGTTDLESNHDLPLITELSGNYPNPFNPETTISFSIAEAGNVTINVYNSRGQKVTTLIDSYMEAGRHKVIWKGMDENNQEVSSGIYFYRMISSDYSSTNKMIIMK